MKTLTETERGEAIIRLMDRFELNDNACWDDTGNKTNSGYGQIWFKGKMYSTHVLSYLTFKGDIDDKQCVCHACDRRECINPDHLWLGSQKDNLCDAAAKGRMASGERNGMSGNGHLVSGEKNGNVKLNDEQVREIFRLSDEGFSQVDIAKIYGVSSSLVCRILTGKRRNDIFLEMTGKLSVKHGLNGDLEFCTSF